MEDAITVYGADWCAMTTRTRHFLDDQKVPYKYIDIDNDPEAAAWVASQNDGKEKKPTLNVNGKVVITPTNTQLEAVLREQNLL